MGFGGAALSGAGGADLSGAGGADAGFCSGAGCLTIIGCGACGGFSGAGEGLATADGFAGGCDARIAGVRGRSAMDGFGGNFKLRSDSDARITTAKRA